MSNDECLNKIAACCKRIEKRLSIEPSLALCEREFHILFHNELLEEFPERNQIIFGLGTRQDMTVSQQKVNRVYRELSLLPNLGRGPRPDFTILENRDQEVLSKSNGGPNSFKPLFSAIIEVKDAINWKGIVNGNTPDRPSITGVRRDMRKYSDKGIELSSFCKNFACIVLTTHPEIFANLSNEQCTVIPVKYPSEFSLVSTSQYPSNNFDYEEHVSQALAKTHDKQKLAPLGMLREKDFETELVNHLRNPPIPYVPVLDWRGEQVGYLNPIRSQWITPKNKDRKEWRHDIVILKHPVKLGKWGPTQQFLPIGYEFELKAVHGASYTWHTKKNVLDKFAGMKEMMDRKELEQGIFLAFRYGGKEWENEVREQLKQVYRSVKIYYLTSYLNDVTEEFK